MSAPRKSERMGVQPETSQGERFSHWSEGKGDRQTRKDVVGYQQRETDALVSGEGGGWATHKENKGHIQGMA